MQWFDAHLDLACLAINKRDMLAPLDELNAPNAHRSVGPWPPAGVTLHSMRQAGVTRALATIFTETNGDGPEGYLEGDARAAREAGLRQLRIYHNWQHDAGIRISRLTDPMAPEETDADGTPVLRHPNARAFKSTTPTHAHDTIELGILIENADPISSPDDLAWWVERGVVAIGLAWWTPSRYAGGNGTDTGLTPLGRDMIRAMDDLGVIHDLSHLSQRSTEELLAATDRPVIASHSNCRALLGDASNKAWQRHLSDDTIREIARRGGVIGLNLCHNFLRYPLNEGERPSVEDAVAHVEHICELVGHREVVGLGSDMDGGFSAKQMCEGIESHADLHRLTDALSARGWSEQDLAAFRWGNWSRFFSQRASQPLSR